jgi:hypothetical protein
MAETIYMFPSIIAMKILFLLSFYPQKKLLRMAPTIRSSKIFKRDPSLLYV